jgi:hypothetical protein
VIGFHRKGIAGIKKQSTEVGLDGLGKQARIQSLGVFDMSKKLIHTNSILHG